MTYALAYVLNKDLYLRCDKKQDVKQIKTKDYGKPGRIRGSDSEGSTGTILQIINNQQKNQNKMKTYTVYISVNP